VEVGRDGGEGVADFEARVLSEPMQTMTIRASNTAYSTAAGRLFPDKAECYGVQRLHGHLCSGAAGRRGRRCGVAQL